MFWSSVQDFHSLGSPISLYTSNNATVKNPYLEFVWVLVCLCIFSMFLITLKDNTFQNYNAQEKLKKIKHINMNSPSVQIHGAQRNFDLTVCTNPRCTKKLLNSLSDLRP